MRISTVKNAGWVRIGKPRGCSYQAISNAAAKAAARKKIRVASYDHVITYMPCSFGAPGRGSMPGRAVYIAKGAFAPEVIAHELGHNLGLGHARDYRCTKAGRPVAFGGSCKSDEYGDKLNLMGSASWPTAISAADRSALGWLGKRGRTLKGTATVRISRLGIDKRSVQGVKVVGKGGRSYFLEYRGRQPGENNYSAGPQGALGLQLRYQRFLVDTTPGSFADRRQDAGDATLPVGSSVTTPDGIRITLTALTSSVATVSVKYGAGAPRPAAAPGAVTATGGAYSARLSWARPADNGSAISGYEITASPGGATKVVKSRGGATTSYTFPGLVAGRAYTFSVRALTEAGKGAAGSSGPAVPSRRGALALLDLQPGRHLDSFNFVTFASPGAQFSPIEIELDPRDPKPVTSVEYLIDGVKRGNGEPDAGWSWTLRRGLPITDGKHTVTTRTTDAAGTVAQASWTFDYVAVPVHVTATPSGSTVTFAWTFHARVPADVRTDAPVFLQPSWGTLTVPGEPTTAAGQVVATWDEVPTESVEVTVYFGGWLPEVPVTLAY